MSGTWTKRAVVADVALALLLGVIERMGVQERPDELAADVFEAKLEVRVLIDGVVTGVKRGGADRGALLFGDLLGDRSGAARSRCARRRSPSPGMRERVAQRDARRRLFDHRGRQRFPRPGWLRGAILKGDGCGHARSQSYTAEPWRIARPASYFLALAPGRFRRLFVLAREAFHAAGGVQHSVCREEGVAIGADFDAQRSPLKVERVLKGVATGAVDRHFMVVGVNFGFHCGSGRWLVCAALVWCAGP